jgi:hypothetical protein
VNAFTQKPDLSQFLKTARHAQNAAKQGRQAKENPSPDQKHALHTPIKQKKK